MEAGLIESFHGPAEEFVLRRGPQQVNVPVRPGGRLLSGDQLEVGTENGHITLWLFDPETHKKSVVVLSKQPQIYVVRGHRQAQHSSSRFSAIWDWAAHELGLRADEAEERIMAAAAIRGGAGLSAPLLESRQVLAAGHRAITLAWTQSEGPVRVVIEAGDSRVLAQEVTSSREWTSPAIDLSPGTYKIVLRENSGEPIVAQLDVAEATALPVLPDASAAEGMPAEMIRTVHATWLAGQARGLYALESLQLVAGLADRYYPAKLLRDALVEGSLPSVPPSR